MIDPDGTPRPIATPLVMPPPGSFEPGSTLQFSFNPGLGDSGTPARYRIDLDVAYGDLGAATVPTRAVHVAGRCGLNPPFADAVVTAPSPLSVGSTIRFDAQSSSDADNDVLKLLTASSTTTGCGLQQNLTFAWSVSPPSGSDSTAFMTPSTGQAATFTPDVVGIHTVWVDVTDDTAAPAGPKTGTRAITFELTPPWARVVARPLAACERAAPWSSPCSSSWRRPSRRPRSRSVSSSRPRD